MTMLHKFCWSCDPIRKATKP